MPSYNFVKKKTGELVSTEIMSIDEMEKKLKKNPDLDVVNGTPPVLGYNLYKIKPDNGFKDLLRMIKKNHPRSTIDV